MVMMRKRVCNKNELCVEKKKKKQNGLFKSVCGLVCSIAKVTIATYTPQTTQLVHEPSDRTMSNGKIG